MDVKYEGRGRKSGGSAAIMGLKRPVSERPPAAPKVESRYC